jgi:hypothetical protein
MNKKVLLTVLILLPSLIVFSQDKDFGMWFGASAKHEIFRNLDLDVSGSLRTNTNSSIFDQYFIQGTGSYSINRYLSAGISYRLIKKLESNSDYYYRHKYFLNLTATVPAGNLTFFGRAMYQITNKTYVENDNDLIAENTARFRLKSKFKIQQTPLKPYLELETFLLLTENSGFKISKYRFAAGTEVKLSRKSSLDLSYIHEKRNNSSNSVMNIISLGYQFDF